MEAGSWEAYNVIVPATVQYALMAVAIPFSVWLLLGGPGRGSSPAAPGARQVMLRALASVAVLISAVFGWMFTLRADAEPPAFRDDSLDEGRAGGETEGEERRRDTRDR